MNSSLMYVVLRKTLVGSVNRKILPRNSEAEAATEQNYHTENAKHHDAYNVPVKENRWASSPPEVSQLLP